MTTMKYVPLRNFTNFSIGESIVKIDDLAKLASEMKLEAVALCNRMNLFCVVDFTYQMLSHKVKPIVGCLIRVFNEDKDLGYMPVYVQNKQGYKTLSNLLSNAYLRSSEIPFINLFDLLLSEDLIVLTGDHEGYFVKLLQHNKDAEAKEFLLSLKEYLKDRLYVETSSHLPLYIQYKITDLAYKLNVPLVGTHNVNFCRKEEAEAYFVFYCIHRKEFFDQDAFQDSSEKFKYLLSFDEIKGKLPPLEEYLSNTNQISERCSFIIEKKNQEAPVFLNSVEDDEIMFRELCNKSLEKIITTIPEDQREIYFQRLQRESSVICEKKFAGYFLVVADFIQWAKENKIPVGAGRGSGAGSLAAYVLGICGIDPIRFGLIFERFLNPERVSMPDFDLDFCQERRTEVIKYVIKKYGQLRVAHISTFGSMQARRAIQDVLTTFKMPYGQIFKITSMVPTSLVEKVTIKSALESNPLFKEFIEEGGEKLIRLINIAQTLEGLVRQPSSHASGIVISPKQDISDIIPLYRDAHHEVCTQFNMHDIEKVGLIKFDFLGLKTLTVIDQCLKLIKENYNTEIILEDLELNETSVYKLISEIYVVGIFQLESSVMQTVIKQLKPDNFDDIIALIALCRPGPMKEIPRYCRRKHGVEKVVFEHPILEPILKNTYGIIVYQEQAMEIARVMANYSYGEADILRRAMGKKKPEEMAAQKSRFMKGSRENNIPDAISEKIFHQVETFAAYAFNKSHAVAYALLVYHTAFLKAKYPEEFFCASMNLEIDKTDKLLNFIYDIKKMNLPIYPPCVNRSNVLFSVQKGKIVYGLEGIKGIGKNIAEEIIQNAPYSSLENFLHKIKAHLNKKVIDQLVYSGALNSLASNMKECLQRCTDFYRSHSSVNILEATGNVDYSFSQKLQLERASLGFFLTYHPSQFFEDMVGLKFRTINYIPDHNEVYYTVCMIESIIKRKSRSERGGVFAFIKFSDHTACVEKMVFSQVLNEYAEHIEENNMVVIQVEYFKSKGTEGEDRSSIKYIISLKEFLSKNTRAISIKIRNFTDLNKIKNIIYNLPEGNIQVKLEGINRSRIMKKRISIDNIEWNDLGLEIKFVF